MQAQYNIFEIYFNSDDHFRKKKLKNAISLVFCLVFLKENTVCSILLIERL